jgi:hypothetical protein
MSRISNKKEIFSFLHCAVCLSEIPPGESPESFARYSVGFTPAGLQVWCVRHNCNIVHIDFEGQQHPANTTRSNN